MKHGKLLSMSLNRLTYAHIASGRLTTMCRLTSEGGRNVDKYAKKESLTWKPLERYKKYEIDTAGTIRIIITKHIMKPSLKDGKLVIRLMDENGNRKEERVHKLVGETFLRTQRPGESLRHINGIKTDNYVGNLEWISKKELGKLTGPHSRRKPVVKLNDDGEALDFYTSAREAAKQNFMSYQTVMDYCNKKNKKKIAPDGYIYKWDD